MKKLIMTAILACTGVQLTAMQQNKVDISGLDKIKLLQALFDRAQPLGLDFMHYDSSHKLSITEAEKILINQRGCADYIKGRVMKVDVSEDTLDTRLFNRDNGIEAAEEVIQKLRTAQK